MDLPMSAAGTTTSKDEQARYKQAAAEFAAGLVQSGMTVGLGTGSTAIFATRRIAHLLSTGELKDIVGFATSKETCDEAKRLGIPLIADELPRDIDITIDGADEVDPQLNVIKGGGGAHLREKIVAQASARLVIVVDEGKLSDRLGTKHSLPVEVLEFGWRSQERFLKKLGARISIRKNKHGEQFVTDSGNMILDCDFGPIADPVLLAATLNARAGVAEHGLFIGLATDLVSAGSGGIRHTRQP
jgi:ribose 5-phosphate isomerase A